MKKDKTALTTFVVILSMILLLTACGKSSKKNEVIKNIEETPAYSFQYEYDPSAAGMKIIEYTGTEIQVRIPDMIDDHPVTCIGDSAFSGSDITYLHIPNTVTAIGKLAFRNCSALTNIVIPDSVTDIGYGAFSCCTSLTSIVIPNSISEIKGRFNGEWTRSEGTFSECTSLTNVEIPNSVTVIGYGAFSDCSSLTNIDIPDSVNEIGKYAFASCTSLTNIKIPKDVTTIEWETFAYCTNLSNVEIHNNVTEIDEDAFYKCTGLTDKTKEKILKINSNSRF